MKDPKTISSTPNPNFAFTRKNYQFMIIGLVIILVGFLLMIGGGSDDPNVFNEEIFSTRRITVAPIVVFIGFAFEVFAIMYKAKPSQK